MSNSIVGIGVWNSWTSWIFLKSWNSCISCTMLVPQCLRLNACATDLVGSFLPGLQVRPRRPGAGRRGVRVPRVHQRRDARVVALGPPWVVAGAAGRVPRPCWGSPRSASTCASLGTRSARSTTTPCGIPKFPEKNLRTDLKIGSPIGSQIGSRIGSPIGSLIGSQIGSQNGSQIGSQNGSLIGSPIGSQIGSQIGSKIGTPFLSFYFCWVQVQRFSQELVRLGVFPGGRPRAHRGLRGIQTLLPHRCWSGPRANPPHPAIAATPPLLSENTGSGFKVQCVCPVLCVLCCAGLWQPQATGWDWTPTTATLCPRAFPWSPAWVRPRPPSKQRTGAS